MANALRIRRDLIIRRQDLREGASYIVKDPESDQFYRFRDVEHFILTQLDGHHTADDLRAAVEDRYGSALPAETLEDFLKMLRKHRLLQSEAPAGPPPPRRSSLLYARFKAFDPEKVLDALEPRTRFFFTRGFVVSAAILAGMALVITALGFPQLVHELQRIHWVKLVAWAWITFLTIGVAHEFAHGLTCRHFGGRVREMGFMFLYFHPALYCNVSDAWLFPEKSKRLWVTFAGGLIELVVWSLAMLTWAITDTDTGIHEIALIALTTTGIKTFFNFNPLLKLDGYYILSDLLEVPNLRRRSFQFVGAHLRRWFGSDAQPEPASARERKIFTWYGSIAVVFSVVFLFFVVTRLAAAFLGPYQAWGIVPFLLLFVLAVRRRLGRLMPKKSATRPAEVVRRPRTVPLLVGGTTCVVGFFLYTLPTDLKVTGEFQVVPIQSAEVRAEVDGLVAEVLVDEGQRVRMGDPIARLDDRELRTQLVKIQSQMDQQAVVSHYASSNLARFRALLDAEVVSVKEFEAAEQQVAVANADIQRLDADRRLVEQQLQSVFITSPIDGVITTSSRQLKELRGRFIRRGDPLAEIHELSTVMAEIAIPEKEIADITRGQQVMLKARAYPNQVFTGRVTSVATRVQNGVDADLAANVSHSGLSGTETSSQQVLVTTLLENPSLMLKPDMTGKAKILCGRRNAGDLVLRRLARTVRVELWSWW